MPTTAALKVFRDADAEPLHGDRPATESNRDLAVIAVFFAIGLALTIGLALLFPLAANVAAMSPAFVDDMTHLTGGKSSQPGDPSANPLVRAGGEYIGQNPHQGIRSQLWGSKIRRHDEEFQAAARPRSPTPEANFQ